MSRRCPTCGEQHGFLRSFVPRPIMNHETISIDQRIADLVRQHGSLRKAGRVVGLTGQYLYRLQSGEKTNPSETVLRKLGLRRVISYVHRSSSTGAK